MRHRHRALLTTLLRSVEVKLIGRFNIACIAAINDFLASNTEPCPWDSHQAILSNRLFTVGTSAEGLGIARLLLEVPQGLGWLCCPVPSPNGHSLAWSERAFEFSVTMLENF